LPISAGTSNPSFLGAGGSSLGAFGLGVGFGGMAVQAVGAYYQTKSQADMLEGEAVQAEYASSISTLNARAAETDAQQILAAGEQQVGLSSERYGQQAGALRASAAARGVEGASLAESAASLDLANQMDSLTITVNAVRSANQARTRAVSESNKALTESVQAENLRSSARSLNPYLSAGSSLLSGAGPLAREWSAYQFRYE
jgi:hypothetical protein